MSCSAVGCEFTVTELAKMFFLLFFLGGACCKACGILVPWPGIKRRPAEMKASLNYWMPGNFLTGILNKVSLNRNTRETSTYINWLIKNIGTRDSQTLYLVFFLGVMVQYLLIQHLRCLFGTWSPWVMWINHSCCSVAKLCLTLYDPMDCSMPGFSVFHYLPEFAQTHDHWVCCHLSISSPAILFSFSMVHKHVCDVYIHIYIHTHMHRYTHTHTHPYTKA